jgi:hypothetical protein
MILKSLYKSVHRVCRQKVAVLVRLIHTPDRLIISLWTGGRMRVIVQFIDDNSRTLHVLLVFDFLYDFSFKRHVS